MKVLHVITSLWTGGAEKLMVDLLPRLRDKGIDVELLTFNGERTAFREELEAKGIKVHDFGTKGAMYSPVKLLKLIPFLKRYDIIHTHNTAPQLFAAIGSILGGGKLVTTEHNTSNRRRGSRLLKIIDRWMYSRYGHVICISAKAEENLRYHLGSVFSNITTVNNGIDVKKFAEAKGGTLLEETAPLSRKIVMVAGFRPQKDQDTLIRSLEFLPAQFHLFLVGEGERWIDLESLTEKLNLKDRVHFLGLRNDIPNLLHEADYVVLSSHWEGFGLSIVEGMAAHKPCIATGVDGLREVVEGAGVLFNQEDAEGLACEIMKLDSNSEIFAEVAERCFGRAQQYDISKMAEGYLNIYDSIK